MCGEERRGSQESVVRFRHRLSDLKRNGSNILLVGTDALAAGCERLLGESGAGPRYRLFVTTDSGPATARRRLRATDPNPDADAAAVVDWRADVRGAAAPTGTGDGSEWGGKPRAGETEVPTLRETTVESDDLGDLGRAVEEAVERFDAEADGLSPAELRLCLDSVTPLAADYETRDLRRFLLGLTETVEGVNGMAHYHLPGEYGSETVEALEPLFDAVVEVQHAEGQVHQRWHLREPDLETDWLPL